MVINESAREIAREKPLPSIEDGAGSPDGAEHRADEKDKGAFRKVTDGAHKGLGRLIGR